MLHNIVGIEKVDYKNQRGNQIKGLKLYCLVENKNVEGSAAETIYLSDRMINDFGRVPKIGDVCEVLYNKYGNITRIDYYGE